METRCSNKKIEEADRYAGDPGTSSLAAAGGCPWRKEPPEDLYNTAPLDQRIDEPFEGELSLMLRGLVADAPGEVLINLPEVRPLIRVETEAPTPAPSAVCDTLIVQADRMQIHLVFRCAMPWSPKTGDRGTVVLRDPAAEERIKREQAEAMP